MKTSPQENFRTLNLVLLICNSFNQLLSEKQNLSGILITIECRYWRICIRQKLVCLLILSKVYSKYDIKKISQSIFFQPFAIIFPGHFFPFNSHQVQLSHLWAVLLTAEGCWWKPLSSGKSNTEPWSQRSGSDPRVAAIWELSTKQGLSDTTRVPLHRGCFPISMFTYCSFSSSSVLVLPDFFRKLKFTSPQWLHIFLSFFPISSLKVIF